MSVRVVFLGPLRDLAESDALEVDAPVTLDDLLDMLPWKVEEQFGLGRVQLACRGEVLADARTLRAEDGDEIALLPPVSGG